MYNSACGLHLHLHPNPYLYFSLGRPCVIMVNASLALDRPENTRAWHEAASTDLGSTEKSQLTSTRHESPDAATSTDCDPRCEFSMRTLLAQAFSDANAPPAPLLERPLEPTGRGSDWEEQELVQQGLLLGKLGAEGGLWQFIRTSKAGDTEFDCGRACGGGELSDRWRPASRSTTYTRRRSPPTPAEEEGARASCTPRC